MLMRLEIGLYASKLKNVAGAYKGISDPFAVVAQIVPGKKPFKVGETEVIYNTLDPKWTKVVKINYEMGQPCKLAVIIYDEVLDTVALGKVVEEGKNLIMGRAVFDVADVLGARGNTRAKKLKTSGTLFMSIRESKGTGKLAFKMRGDKLTNVEGLFGKSDPFFELARQVDAVRGVRSWDNIHRSETVRNNLNPCWEKAQVKLSSLCDGDLNRPIEITVYDFESSGAHVLMGRCETSVNGILAASKSGNSMEIFNREKPTGSIFFYDAETIDIEDVEHQLSQMSVSRTITNGPSFLDYISGGCEIACSVAIDFTGSNGDPRQPGTLHYLDPSGDVSTRNPYQKAISAIVSALAKYDSDKRYSVFGFGAKYGGVVRHCFQCGPLPVVSGLKGILRAYYETFSSGLIMSGPTVFTEVIRASASRAKTKFEEGLKEGRQVYSILLIVTDGSVSDTMATANVLDEVSGAPLSILIVGVGDADFSNMKFLADYANVPGKRDIAQFVPFSQYANDSAALTKASLGDIPYQLSSFFSSRGIMPLPPIVVDVNSASYTVDEEDDKINQSLDVGHRGTVISGGDNAFVCGYAWL